MNTVGGEQGGNIARTQHHAITQIQDTRGQIDRVLTLLDDGYDYFSQAEIAEALGSDSQVGTLIQTLQVASRDLGHVLYFFRHGSRSKDSTSPALHSTTEEQVARPEEVQAEPGNESRAEPRPISETPAAERLENCTICFEEISTLCILQPCGHKFDMDCLMPWLISVYTEWYDESLLRCPLCRQIIDTLRYSIISDGTATLMIVGPHFRQQFSRHRFQRSGEDLMVPLDYLSLHRLVNDLDDRFPGNGAVASYLPNGPLVEELRRRQRAEILMNSRRSAIQPVFVREDHIADEDFERMSQQDILDMIDRRERLNTARERWLEVMGEGASTDLHRERR
ncbi:hypothetical protein ONS95_014920 [Cadophora gregata]|uniref:uncharacterized protein n=1 Tax=Cadophora gregata TaxID=51156 RepID=UPI0026DB0967|nr:uncharacterized protein ONS95_014920 [Cadophora gregata]KAK0113225.1 hypothetical protein ONS95_014920 [Cadophora gregata]KAK0125267.1 hypothetical protein ONS96_009122 [Cadophora gregata f. sp. sojae]